jgi:hypothetical protein
MPQPDSPGSLSQPPCAEKHRITHVRVVFSDEWNWSFSPRNLRSRRRRFLNSGERISGFTAIFCDDWKDDIDEDQDIDDYILRSKREREDDMDFFTENWDLSQPRSKRQRLESRVESLSILAESSESQLSSPTNFPPESLSFTATTPESELSLYIGSPEPKLYHFDEFESKKSPSSLGYLEHNVNSRLVDSEEEKLMIPGVVLSEDLPPNVPKLVQHLDLDIAALDKVDRDLYLALMSDESENYSTGVMNPNLKTKKSNDMMCSCEEAAASEQWSQNDGCELEPGGFEFWDDFMQCCMGVHSDHDVEECFRSNAPNEPRFELCFEEMIDCSAIT